MKKPLLICLIVFPVAAVATFFIASAFLSNHKTNSPEELPNTETPVLPELASASSRLLFMGDVFWGRRINTWSRASDLGVKYPFSHLSEFDRDEYDAWVANLECPVTNNGHDNYAEEELLSFNCDPDYLPEAAKFFTAVSLANNHTDNQGADGFTETKQHLTDNSIQYFGHYDYKNADQVCGVIKVSTTLAYADNTKQKASIPLALCGYHGVYGIPVETALQKIQEYSKYLPVIVMPHMGAEYQNSSNTLRENIYRKMIDYGADMVLGNHPHWVQNAEAYKGKLIAYSLGNFIFDQQSSREVTRSALIDVTLNLSDPNLIKDYTQIAESCSGDIDLCIEIITSENLPKLQPIYTFDVKASDGSNKTFRPADEALLNSVKDRLDWNSVAPLLNS